MSRSIRPIGAHLYISQRRLIHHLLFEILFTPLSFPSTFHNILGQEGTRSSKTKLGSFGHQTEDATRRAIYSGERKRRILVGEHFAPLDAEQCSAELNV